MSSGDRKYFFATFQLRQLRLRNANLRGQVFRIAGLEVTRLLQQVGDQVVISAQDSATSARLIPIARQQVTAAQEALRITQENFAAGTGLFLDLEIRLVNGPVFVGQEYTLSREIVGVGQSRRTESYWTKTTLGDVVSGDPVAVVLLHSGVFKDSFPGYPG